ncbi:MAG: transporter substrate-binding domain-containing protein [Candidatus Thermoplasmatota archaeon]|nr:transporter substrate-binding domain-containing protein [Candidatus Thermoplasmatota archaeon]
MDVKTVNRAASVSISLLIITLLISCLLPMGFSQQNGDLTIKCGAYDNPPKVYPDGSGGHTGFFPDILEVIAEKENWQIEYVFGNWTDCLDRLESGEIDIMVDVGYSEERAAIYDFNNETVFNNWGMVYRDPDVSIESITDLEGKRVGVMKGSVHTEGKEGIKALAKSFNINCTFMEVDSYEDVFKLIDAGLADAGVVNRLFGQMNDYKFNVKATNIFFDPSELRFGFPKNATLNAVLIEGIDRNLHEMKADQNSEYYTILNGYFGYPGQEGTAIPGWVLPAAAAAAATIGFLFILSAVFKWQVEKRTKELKTALEKREELERVINRSSSVAFLWRNEEGWPVEMVSDNIALFGYTPDELRSGELKFTEIVHPDDLARIGGEVEKYSKEGKKEFVQTYRILAKSGDVRWVEDHTFIRRDAKGKITHYQGIVTDITERKKAEEMSTELEAVKRLSELKTRFVSTATHELRTPVVSIKGYTDLMISGRVGEIPQKPKEMLGVISRNTDRLLHLVEDLLDVQRIESGRLKMEIVPMDLREVLKQCQRELKPLMDDRHHTFNVQIPDHSLQINGDFSRLNQVLSNMLMNSQKFAPEGGKVEVSVEEKPDSVRISVKDNGIGIRKEDIAKVFDLFSDIKKPGNIKGTGLGLSVAKGIVEGHGGKIEAFSEGEGKGATFTVILPKKK